MSQETQKKLDKFMYSERYKVKCFEYITDTSSEGKVAKYAALREQEYFLENYFGFSQEEIQNMYNDVYQKYHNFRRMPA